MKTTQNDSAPHHTTPYRLTEPTARDGLAVHQLIANCPPLDPNSVYCNLLQCHHFAATSVKAEQNGKLAGFISGYIPPAEPDVLFIWQVAVAEQARGQGLGRRMLSHLLERPACRGVRYLHTTVTPDNRASLAMFASLARAVGGSVSERVLFDQTLHFGGQHPSEVLQIIGPVR